MEITLELVERLREKADISYAKAKQALEYSGGNLLDALIYLEEQGEIPRCQKGYYSTRSETPPPRPEIQVQQEKEQQKVRGKARGSFFHRIRYLLLDNELEIWRRERPVTAMPVLILVLLMIVAFYITIPLLMIGLFFGFRYRFSGPDLERESINSVMNNVADTAAGLGRQVVDELRNQHDKYKGKNDK